METACWVAAAVEVVLAGAAHLFASAGLCPAEGTGAFGCGTLVRPRLVQLFGSISVSQVAVTGAMASLLLAILLASGRLERTASAWSARLLAGGAGFAIGLQLLSPAATGQICPVCLGIAGAALAVGVLFALATSRRSGVRPGVSLGILLGASLLCGALSCLAGLAIRDEDVARRIAVQGAGGAEGGARVVVVVRDGCPYCEALLLDVLGAPATLEVLRQAKEVDVVDAASRAGHRLAGGGGVPLLVVVGGDRAERARLRGLRPEAEVQRWLSQALAD